MAIRLLLAILLCALLLAAVPVAFAQMSPGQPGRMISPMPSISPAAPEIPIGPDGTAYLLRPQINISLGFVRTVEYKTDIVPVTLDKNQPPKWKLATIPGLVQRAEAGEAYLYLLLGTPTPTPMPLGTATGTATGLIAIAPSESQVIFLNYADGTQFKTVKVQGNVLGMQVRKIASTEYIYLTVVRPASAGQSASVGLAILNSAGNQVNTLDAETDALEQT